MFHKLQCNLHTNVHVMYNHWEIVISTWCCWWPVYCESFHLVPFECKDWWWRLLVSDIGRHDIGVIDSIEGACQVPEVYISLLRPCCCNLLLSDCCCLSKNTKQFTWLHEQSHKTFSSWMLVRYEFFFLPGYLLNEKFRNAVNIVFLFLSKVTRILLIHPACLMRAVSSSGFLSSSSSLSESLSSSSSSDLGFVVRCRLLIFNTITWFCWPLALCEPETP